MPGTKTSTGSLLRRGFGRWEARDIAPLVSLAVLVIFFTFAAPSFLKLGSLMLILERGSVLAIVSVGLTYVLLCGEIDLAVGNMAVWSACFCGWLFVWMGEPGGHGAASAWMVSLVILLPLASCALLGFLSGMLTVTSRLPSFIISLAMMFIAKGLAQILTRGEPHVVPGLLRSIGNDDIGGTSLPRSMILAVVVLLLSHFVLRYTRFGRYIYATGGNREAARLAGIRTGWVVIACMAICAVTAGISGLVKAGQMNKATLDQNQEMLLSAVACVVLGGTSLFGGEGSIGKTVIGVATFAVLQVGLLQLNTISLGFIAIPVDDFARSLLTGIVLMVALVINGLLARGK